MEGTFRPGIMEQPPLVVHPRGPGGRQVGSLMGQTAGIYRFKTWCYWSLAREGQLSDLGDVGRDMILFEQYARKAEAISRIGEDVRADARASKTTVSYTEPAYGTDVIREYSDGHRERVKADGSVVAVPPRGR